MINAQDAKIIVTDPYNEERAAASGYEREKPRGVVRQRRIEGGIWSSMRFYGIMRTKGAIQ